MTDPAIDPARRGLAGLARRGKLLLSAGAIALAGIAAPGSPARAQTTEELLAFILGTAAVATIIRSYDSESRTRQQMRPGVLPDACLERVQLRGRNIDLYHAGCLGWYGIDRLPRRCETPIRTNVGPRRYFLARCLYESNWRSQGGRVTSRPYWDAPAIAPWPHPDRGWRDGRDRDRGGRGWSGRDRDGRDWRDRDREGRDWRDRDRDGRDWSRDDRRRGQRDDRQRQRGRGDRQVGPVAPGWDPSRDGESDRWIHMGP